jgi:hypothetical protein
MKKIIITYGLIAGTIVAGMMLITMPMYNSGALKIENGELLGYSTMVIALSVIFLGVKSYRDKHSNGVISFGKGLKIGLLITLIAGLMYGLAWEYIYPQVGDEFMQKYTELKIAEMKADGATEAKITEWKQESAQMVELYKNFFFRFTFTVIVEIFPVGVIISLISAALLRRKEFLPATEPSIAQ